MTAWLKNYFIWINESR